MKNCNILGGESERWLTLERRLFFTENRFYLITTFQACTYFIHEILMSEYAHDCLVGCDNVLSSKNIPKIQRKLLPSSVGYFWS
jgi:hypothetical protein